jgi:hypothetical protein
MSLKDYFDFICRARLKDYQEKKRWETVGNCFEIIQTVPNVHSHNGINVDK